MVQIAIPSYGSEPGRAVASRLGNYALFRELIQDWTDSDVHPIRFPDKRTGSGNSPRRRNRHKVTREIVMAAHVCFSLRMTFVIWLGIGTVGAATLAARLAFFGTDMDKKSS